MILPEDYSKYTVVADCLRKPRETPMAFYNEDEPKTESHVFDFITACVVTLSLLIAGIYIIVS